MAFTSFLPSGYPQTHMMWVGTDGEHLLVNTEVHRRKFRNVERDPRVTVMLRDEENPYRYVEVRGEHVDELSHKYHGRPYEKPDPQRARDAANRCLAPIHIPAQLNGVEPRGFPGRTENQTHPTGGSLLARLFFGMRRAWLAAIIPR